MENVNFSNIKQQKKKKNNIKEKLRDTFFFNLKLIYLKTREAKIKRGKQTDDL